LAAANVILNKYPDATLKNVKDLTLTNWNTYIGTLGATSQDQIFNCVDRSRVEEVVGTAVVTCTVGLINEIGAVFVNDGVQNICIGSYKSTAVDATTDGGLLEASIDAGTPYHGFSAINAAGAVTISAPAGTGAGANAYVATANVDTGGTLAIAITTDFAAAATGVTAVGVLGDISEALFVDLEAKIVAAAEETGTARAGAANNKIRLALASASAVDDYYNGMMVFLDGGTGDNQARFVLDYDGALQEATVDDDWGTNPDGTSTYIVTSDLLGYGTAYSSIQGEQWAWQALYPGVSLPKAIEYISDDGWPLTQGTASSGTATRLYDTSKTWVVDAYNGYYVAIISGTGAGQSRLITDTVATYVVVGTWTVNPDSTSVYQIVEYEDDLLKDIYMENVIPVYLSDLTDATHLNGWTKLLDYGKLHDQYNELADSHASSPYQDMAYLSEVLTKGKALYDNGLL
jgi:hypothetical protein